VINFLFCENWLLAPQSYHPMFASINEITSVYQKALQVYIVKLY